jgi:hypothetical protein
MIDPKSRLFLRRSKSAYDNMKISVNTFGLSIKSRFRKRSIRNVLIATAIESLPTPRHHSCGWNSKFLDDIFFRTSLIQCQYFRI